MHHWWWDNWQLKFFSGKQLSGGNLGSQEEVWRRLTEPPGRRSSLPWKALYAAEYSWLQLQDTRPIGQGASTACLLLAKEQNRAFWLVKTLDGQDCLPKVTPYSTKSQLVADIW